MGDVKALKDSNPESALVLDDFDQNNPPQLSSVPYKQLPLQEVAVGSFVLVKAGEVCPNKICVHKALCSCKNLEPLMNLQRTEIGGGCIEE